MVPEPDALNFPRDCPELVVAGGYSSFRWFLLGDDEMTFDSHMAALRLLSARRDGAAVFFGQMGTGLAMDGNDKCRATSRGLMLVKEGGTSAVYSYYKWP